VSLELCDKRDGFLAASCLTKSVVAEAMLSGARHSVWESGSGALIYNGWICLTFD
jgi:hypothetical protein